MDEDSDDEFGLKNDPDLQAIMVDVSNKKQDDDDDDFFGSDDDTTNP